MDSRLGAYDTHGVAFAVTVAHVSLVDFVVFPTIANRSQGILALQLRYSLEQMDANTLRVPLGPHDSMPMWTISLLVRSVLNHEVTGAHLPDEL